MGLKNAVNYEGPPLGARVILNNPNGSIATSAKVLSGVGPFDFSGAADIANVPVTVKIDNAAAIVTDIDLSAAVDDAAVTVAELVTAWSAIATATGVTATTDTDTGRLKLAKTTVGSSKYLQVTGEFARLAGFGYGYGAMIIPINTQQSVGAEVVQRDSERLEILDAQGEGSAIVTDPKRTGATLTMADTAYDRLLGAIMTGASYDFTTGKVGAPLSDSVKPTFTFEWYVSMYEKDDNQEANFVQVLQRRAQMCKVTTTAGGAGDRNLQAKTYTISATVYKDPITKVRTPDTEETPLTVEAWEALDIFDV